MPKFIRCFSLFFCIAPYAFSQHITIHGSVQDTSEHTGIANSVIMVMRQSDSALLGFTRSNTSGDFTLKNLPAGKVILMITHPLYADYVEEMDLATSSGFNLGKIAMIRKSELLKEVIVSNKWTIRVKGDTTEYKADSFYLHPGSTVEDLLKKLPGIQVDRNGQITAYGETVQRVLIDGEEFFSDDPTIITQNFLAESIDKVQVYDKKSEEATFTGIDDGKKSKTINLQLKEDRKKGFFGKTELGTDLRKYWNNNAMLNAFKGKRKFSVYGIMSNTGKAGLNMKENMDYGTGGGMGMSNSGGDDLSQESYYGEGLPEVWSGGAQYANKWNGDKIGVNAGYQYKKINTEVRGSTLSEYILPDTLYHINENGNTQASRFQHSMNGKFDYALDSSSSISVTTHAYTGSSTSINNNYSESLDEMGKYVNTSDRNSFSEANNKMLSTDLYYRKKFRKPGRALFATISTNYNQTNADGLFNADYKYYDAQGSVKQEEATDQQRLTGNTRSQFSSRLIYTQPVSAKTTLQFNYGLSNSYSHSDINVVGKYPVGSGYENPIDSLSNDFSLNILSNSAGINYYYNKSKNIIFAFGGNISLSDYINKDLKQQISTPYHFINLSPAASLNLTLPAGSRLNLYYSGNTQSPSIDQIQPVKDNTDLLNRRIGNPDLKQAFRHSSTLNFSNYKLLSQRLIDIRLNYNNTQNDFSAINFVDDLGRRITQPVNVSGNNSYSIQASYSKMLQKANIRVRTDMQINGDHNTNFINELKNINRTLNIIVGARVDFVKDKKYDFSIHPRVVFVRSTSSIRPDEPTQYFQQEHEVSGSVDLPWKMRLVSDCAFSLRQKIDAFNDNNNYIKWNARLDKTFLKNGDCILRLAAFDILDQNIGVRRYVNSNFISERTFDTLHRYFMLSLIYNFRNNGTPRK